MGKPPEKKFRIGNCEAAVFANDVTVNGESRTTRKVVLQKLYKGKDGDWRTTNSFFRNDIPKAIICLAKSYEYLLSRPGNELDESNGSDGNDQAGWL